jgi:hypothetical protein
LNVFFFFCKIKYLFYILGDKYILGTDSLVIRNFSYYDQGIYYCRAFITLKTNFLNKIYPILVQLQSKNIYIYFIFFIYLFIKILHHILIIHYHHQFKINIVMNLLTQL